jgi:hypothetical protein
MRYTHEELKAWLAKHGTIRGGDGFLGIGGSSAKTDRGNQLAATQGTWNVFNSGLGLESQQNATGQEQQATGQTNLNSATNYWSNLLTAGRTQTAQNAAPAVQAVVSGADAQRNQQSEFGTGRTGGTAAQNQTAATTTQGSIDNIINENLVGGKTAAATGLAGAGATDLSAGSTAISQALASLGISGSSASSILNNATQSYQYNQQNNGQIASSVGEALASFLFL